MPDDDATRSHSEDDSAHRFRAPAERDLIQLPSVLSSGHRHHPVENMSRYRSSCARRDLADITFRIISTRYTAQVSHDDDGSEITLSFLAESKSVKSVVVPPPPAATTTTLSNVCVCDLKSVQHKTKSPSLGGCCLTE